MSFPTYSRCEDPNVSMRLIQKIKNKCQDYFRSPPTQISDSYISDLQNDILFFKKDCLVATELAQQYIEKSLELAPKTQSRSETLKLECEIERLTEQNFQLTQELNKKLSQSPDDILNNLPGQSSVPDEEHEKMISELQTQLVIQEFKYENSLSDLESQNKDLKKAKETLENSLKDLEKKNEVLEKKIKESLSGYTKFLLRKGYEGKETQTGNICMNIEAGVGIEVQRTNEFMSQISRLSITESEIFDVTSMQVCDIYHQNFIQIKVDRKLKMEVFKVVRVETKLGFEYFGVGVKGTSNLETDINF